jgi:hypothetical protein
MANWLDKALGRDRSTTSIAIVPFDIQCDCGARLTGVRADRAKRAICARCGEAHFILPINRYPESVRSYFEQAATDDNAPASRHSDPEGTGDRESESAGSYAIRTRQRAVDNAAPDSGLSVGASESPHAAPEKFSSADDSEDPLDFLDEPVESGRRSRKRRDALYASPDGIEPVPRQKRPVPESPGRREASGRDRQKRQAGAIPSGMIEIPPADSEWGETRKRIVLVVAGIAVLALGMALWVIRQQKLDRAEAQLATATDAGLDAFEAGDFLEAGEQLKIALNALAVIGADEEQIVPLRRRWLEAELATHLLDGSLIDLVEATRDAESLKREDRQRLFDARFASRWLLLDLSPVELVTTDANDDDSEAMQGETRLLYPWTLDDKPIHVAGVESLVSDNRGRIVLAGRVSNCDFDDATQAWVVRMDPDDSFLWTNFSVLVQLGFVAEEDDQGLKQILRDQQGASGSSPGTSNKELPQSRPNAESEETEQP